MVKVLFELISCSCWCYLYCILEHFVMNVANVLFNCNTLNYSCGWQVCEGTGEVLE